MGDSTKKKTIMFDSIHSIQCHKRVDSIQFNA